MPGNDTKTSTTPTPQTTPAPRAQTAPATAPARAQTAPVTTQTTPPAPATQTGPAASATTAVFNVTLSAAAEVPPNSSMATGRMEASLDRKTSVLRWKLTYTGLTGPATMAHFHGPAMPGANAGVVLPLPNAASGSSAEGTLTPAQVADLMAGKWYINVHTAANPNGEIRGQLIAR